MSNFPPCTPFARQQAMASRRAQGSIRPEDSVSSASWSVVHDGQHGGSVSGNVQSFGHAQGEGQASAPKAPPPGFAPAGPAYGNGHRISQPRLTRTLMMLPLLT